MKSLGRILVVADDAVELDRLKALFSHGASAWETQFCPSDREATTYLSETECEVIFAGLSAGPLATAQFLHEVWKKHPKTVRYLLADSIDTDVMVTCVLGAHQYLQQPIEQEALHSALERVAFINRLVRNPRIQSLVSRMRTLPSRPSLYLEVMRELRSSNANAKVVGELVAKDLAISTKLIQVVNSAYYGLAQQVTEAADAILLLGMETTASLILSIEAFARFDKVKPLYFSIDRVWKHSQSVAHSAKKIAEAMTNDTSIAKDAFTAGLLHDVGKLALALNFEEQYQGALKLAEKNNLQAWEVETEVFGASHAEAGAYLLSLWGLPLPIIEAVASHHLPSQELGKDFNAVTAVHLVERLEYEKDLAAIPGSTIQVDLNYPPELQIEDHLENFRAIIRGDDLEGSGGTMFFVKNAARNSAQGDDAVETLDAKSGVPIIVPAAEPIQYREATPRRNPGSMRIVGAAVGIAILILGSVWYSRSTPEKALGRESGTQDMARVDSPKAEKETEISMAKKEAINAPTNGASASIREPNTEVFSGLKLQGIMYHGVSSSVLINGKTLHLGDQIDGARVFSVEPLQVTLEKDGMQHKLKLK
jgi:putative nucleotidyltransferase with HDIG domain